MVRNATKAVWVLVCVCFLLSVTSRELRAQNLIANGDFSAGILGWVVVPTEPPPWPLVDGAVNLHPPSGGYTGTIIYQNLSITGVGGKSYTFSMKLVKSGTPDDGWRTVAVYLTYLDSGTPVRTTLANPMNGEISTPVSLGPLPTFSGTVAASITLPSTATAITKIEIAKENFGDFTIDDIVFAPAAASEDCTFVVARAGSANPISVYLGPEGGDATLHITASSEDCAWSAAVQPGVEWLSINGIAAGTGSGEISINAAANATAGVPRMAFVSLGSGKNGFAVHQLAPPLPRSVIPLGATQTPRGGYHTALRLLNGKVLIAGGHNGTGPAGATATAELYDPATRTFTLTGSMHVPRMGHTATLLLDGRVLVAGGFHALDGISTNIDSAELYDPATGVFTLLASKMSTPRQLYTATAIMDPISKGMKILFAGGASAMTETTVSVTNTADLYDAASGVFTPTGTMVTGRVYHRATPLSETKVLLAGGSNGAGALAGAEIYDAATGTFSATGSMAAARTMAGNFQIVFGGGLTEMNNPGTVLTSTEIYNPLTGTFSAYGTLNHGRFGAEVTQLTDGRLLVSGGCPLNATMEILDLSTDDFTVTTAQMTTPRLFHTATYLPGLSPEYDILIVGGDPGGTAELYSTAAAPPAKVTLTIVKSGDGAGTVTSVPAGIACGDICTASFDAGTTVTLTAAAAPGAVFSGWSGGGCGGTGTCTVTLNAATTVTAAFHLQTAANAGPDLVVFDSAHLDGSASQGNIISYQWTLTHRTNAAYNRTATGATPDLTDLQPGFYDVTLTVTDGASQTGTATALLAVAGPCGNGGSGPQGLGEAIYILQQLVGMRPE